MPDRGGKAYREWLTEAGQIYHDAFSATDVSDSLLKYWGGIYAIAAQDRKKYFSKSLFRRITSTDAQLRKASSHEWRKHRKEIEHLRKTKFRSRKRPGIKAIEEFIDLKTGGWPHTVDDLKAANRRVEDFSEYSGSRTWYADVHRFRARLSKAPTGAIESVVATIGGGVYYLVTGRERWRAAFEAAEKTKPLVDLARAVGAVGGGGQIPKSSSGQPNKPVAIEIGRPLPKNDPKSVKNRSVESRMASGLNRRANKSQPVAPAKRMSPAPPAKRTNVSPKSSPSTRPKAPGKPPTHSQKKPQTPQKSQKSRGSILLNIYKRLKSERKNRKDFTEKERGKFISLTQNRKIWRRLLEKAERYVKSFKSGSRQSAIDSVKGFILEQLFVKTSKHGDTIKWAKKMAGKLGYDANSVRFTMDVRDRVDGRSGELTDGIVYARKGNRYLILAVVESKSKNFRELVNESKHSRGQIERSLARLETMDIYIDGKRVPAENRRMLPDYRRRTPFIALVPKGLLTHRQRINLEKDLGKQGRLRVWVTEAPMSEPAARITAEVLLSELSKY